MRESARTGLSWLPANAARYGLDPAFQRDTDIHLHVQSDEVPKEGASAGVTMAAALVSALTRHPVRGGLAITCEITLYDKCSRHRRQGAGRVPCGLNRVLLPRQNRKQVDEDLGDNLRRVVAVDYVTRVDELLELALRPSRPRAAWRRSSRPAARPEPRRPGTSRHVATRTSNEQHDLYMLRRAARPPLHARPAAGPRTTTPAPNPNTTPSSSALIGSDRNR